MGFVDFSINGVASHNVTVLGEVWVRACSSRDRVHRNLSSVRDLFIVKDDSVENGSEGGAVLVARRDHVLEGEESTDSPG